jgi:hypothetical protein
MTRPFSCFCAAVMLQALFAGTGRGQERAPDLPSGWVVGLSAAHVRFAFPLVDAEGITGLSTSVFWLPSRWPGFDAAVTVLPPTGRYDLHGAVIDLGGVLSFRSGHTALLARTGASVAGGYNSTGGYLAGIGAYGGLGGLVALSDRVALRADLSRRSYTEDAPITWSASAGAALLPRQRGGAGRRRPRHENANVPGIDGVACDVSSVHRPPESSPPPRSTPPFSPLDPASTRA